jgi:outer membrane protein assembly factor BamB
MPTPSTAGATLWTRRYDAGSYDDAHAISVSPDGSAVFVTGVSGDEGDYATRAYDATTGAVLWTRRYSLPPPSYDSAEALAVSPDGSTVFVTGWAWNDAGDYEYVTLAYDASTGATVWKRAYNAAPGSEEYGEAVAVSRDGTAVFVTGRMCLQPCFEYYYATVAYDSVTGAQLWANRHHLGRGWSLGVSPDGLTVFVSGQSDTMAYDASTGQDIWVRNFPGGLASHLVVSPDGSAVFVTGGEGTGYQEDFRTIAYSPTGTRLWSKSYDGLAHLGDEPAGLAVSPDSSTLFVTGFSGGSTTDSAMLAYEAGSGAIKWTKRYDIGAPVAGPMVSPDGATLYVARAAYSSTSSYDYVTSAHDATDGHRLWVRRYNAPANGIDYPLALALKQDGSALFVTGYSQGPSYHDYLTLAYSTN